MKKTILSDLIVVIVTAAVVIFALVVLDAAAIWIVDEKTTTMIMGALNLIATISCTAIICKKLNK